MNCSNVKWAASVQSVFTATKIFALLIIIFTGLYLLFSGKKFFFQFCFTVDYLKKNNSCLVYCIFFFFITYNSEVYLRTEQALGSVRPNWEYIYCNVLCLLKKAGSLALWVEYLPMVRETWVQSQVASYQRLQKLYLIPPCLTLSNIKYVSRVKWSNPGKGVAPSSTPWCSSY